MGEERVLTAGPLQLDPTYRTVRVDGKAVELTATEFDLLHHFILHPGRPFSRADLLDLTQPDASGDLSAYERTIDVHVKNLRHKLGVGGRRSRFIETVQGIGYRFAPDAAHTEGDAAHIED
jgi:DNA-binding response OmpR family regulator